MSSFSIFSQENLYTDVQKANYYFQKNDFIRAYEFYNSDTLYNDTLKLNKALCLEKLYKYQEANIIFNKISIEKYNTRHIISYANVLTGLEKYKEALQLLEKITNKNESTLLKINQLNWAIGQNKQKQRPSYEVIKTNLQTNGYSLGLFFDNDKIYYSKNVGNQKHQDYDLVFSNQLSDTTFENKANILNKKIKTPFYEGAPFIQNNKLFFVRNNYIKSKISKEEALKNGNINSLHIYTIDLVDKKWKYLKALNINKKDYNFIHPFLSEDGNTLYFSSDMPGGYGGFDIYKSKLKNNGEWGEPKNLGKTINTIENELFPIIKNELLFFTSRGHLGFGGADIFSCKLKNDEWQTPENLGKPINSSADDFSLIFKPESSAGYFATNRNGKDDEVYFFKPYFQKKEAYTIVVDNETKKLVNNISVQITSKIERNVYVGQAGEINYQTLVSEPYKINIDADGYKPQEYDIKNENKSKEKNNFRKIELTAWLKGNIYSENSSSIIRNVVVKAFDAKSQLKITETSTDRNGFWNIISPEFRNIYLVFEHPDYKTKKIYINAYLRDEALTTKINKIILEKK